jgi:hypothetical protein
MLTFDEASHTYRKGGVLVPSVTQILAPLFDFSSVPAGVLAHASARGTAIHMACELFDQDDLDWSSVSDEILPYVEAYVEFRMATGFKPTHSEHRVFHQGLLYAGTLDLAGPVDGERSIIDIKSCTVLSPAVGIQLAAYAEALSLEEPEQPKYTGRYALQLKKDGRFVFERYTDKTDWPTFIALKTVTSWANKHKQGVHYEPAN